MMGMSEESFLWGSGCTFSHFQRIKRTQHFDNLLSKISYN